MKRLFLFCAAICVLFICGGCAFNAGIKTNNTELSPEAQLMQDNYPIKAIVQHNSLDELLENCAAEDIKSAYEAFPVDRFERIYYFNAYFQGDDDLKFPISIIAFDDGGITYYFSGAEQEHNPFVPGFSSYSKYRIYAAKDKAAAKILLDDWRRAGAVTYYGHNAGYALSVNPPVEHDDYKEYFDVLSAIVGAEFRCVRNDNVSIEGNTVYVDYKFDDECALATYTLSNPDVLRELLFSYEEGGESEIVDYSDDPDAPGADMIMHPNRVSIEFETVGTGRTVLNIQDDDGENIYSVEIEVDGEFGAFLPE